MSLYGSIQHKSRQFDPTTECVINYLENENRKKSWLSKILKEQDLSLLAKLLNFDQTPSSFEEPLNSYLELSFGLTD